MSEQPQEQPDETQGDTPDETAPPVAPDEEEQEAEEESESVEGHEHEGEPPPEASAPVGAVGEKELEKMFKRVETANASYSRKLGEIMGEEAQVLEQCPRCSAPFLGFIFPPLMQPVSAEVKDAVLVSVGEQPAAATEKDNYARQCDSCKGMGVTLSGSRTNRDKTLTCYDCKGRGWVAVGPERQGAQIEQPSAVVQNGEQPVIEQPPDADPWGRKPGDPDYGRLPQYVGAS